MRLGRLFVSLLFLLGPKVNTVEKLSELRKAGMNVGEFNGWLLHLPTHAKEAMSEIDHVTD